tara:strand:- start:899 stop:1312 length:414 start_codon:yes stop_codon:yes gene_type:complete
MNSEIYLYIPREKILNQVKRKHRTEDFRKLYFYREQKKYVFNDKNIIEIDIYKVDNIQINTLYKDNYKSVNDKFFDHYKVLKPEYNDCDDIYIETKTKNKDYNENKKKQIRKTKDYNLKKKDNLKENNKDKFIISFN